MFRICRIEEDEMTGQESIVLVSVVKDLKELSLFKQTYPNALPHLIILDQKDEEIEWEDII